MASPPGGHPLFLRGLGLHEPIDDQEPQQRPSEDVSALRVLACVVLAEIIAKPDQAPALQAIDGGVAAQSALLYAAQVQQLDSRDVLL